MCLMGQELCVHVSCHLVTVHCGWLVPAAASTAAAAAAAAYYAILEINYPSALSLPFSLALSLSLSLSVQGIN